MKSIIAKKTQVTLAFFVLVSVAVVSSSAQVLNQPASQTIQSRERVIEKINYSNEPFIVSLKVKGKDREVGKKFAEEDDWMKGLSIRIENVHLTPIVYIVLNLNFSETGSQGPPMGHEIHIGQNPRAKISIGKSISLGQNEATTFSFSDEEYANLNRFLVTRGHKMENLSKVKIFIDLVIFADGNKWSNGNYYIPDASSPTGFRPIKQ